MRQILAGILFLASAVCGVVPAVAQTSSATVVAACGTPPATYPAGANRALTQDTTGKLCDSGGGGSGSNASVGTNGATAPSSSTQIGIVNGSGNLQPASATNPVPVSGTFSASLAGFNPTAGATANISDIVNVSQDVALPAGADVTVTNKGSVTINFRLQAGAGTAVSTDQALVAGAAAGFHITTATHLSAIAPTGTGTGTTAGQLNIQGGTGLVTGYGGGSSGGGSGGAVTCAACSTSALQTSVGATAHSDAVAQLAGTQPVSAASLPLPTGASTSALQPSNSAIGATTSGQTGTLAMGATTTAAPTYTTAQSNPLSLDTAGNLRVNVVTGSSSGAVAQGSTTSGQSVVPMGCRTLTSAPTDTTAQTNMPSCDTAGALRVNVTTATGVAQGSTSSGQTISPVGCRTLTSAPTDTTAQTNMPWCRTNGAQAHDLASINGTTVSAGTGAQGAGAQRVTIATDTATIAGSAPGTAGTASSNVVTVQGVTSMTPVQVSQATAGNLNATVTLAAGSALAGKVGIDQTTLGTTNGVSAVAATTGGTTPFTLTAAASTNATNIKNAAGLVDHISVYNNSATLAWVSFYDNASTPTCGTAIKYQVMIPANSTSGAGAVEDYAVGVGHASGIGICVTTGIAGTGNVAASAYVVNVFYK